MPRRGCTRRELEPGRHPRVAAAAPARSLCPPSPSPWPHLGPARLPTQVRETDSFHVAKLAKRDDRGTDDAILVLLPTVEGGGARCHMRSLGYMGSFLLAYSSAQVGAGGGGRAPRGEGRWVAGCPRPAGGSCCPVCQQARARRTV